MHDVALWCCPESGRSVSVASTEAAGEVSGEVTDAEVPVRVVNAATDRRRATWAEEQDRRCIADLP